MALIQIAISRIFVRSDNPSPPPSDGLALTNLRESRPRIGHR